MQVPLVMSVIGQDRPGLIEIVARIVARHGGNWLESRMCRLGGEFAGILRIHVPDGQKASLIAALAGLESQGLKVVVYADQPPTAVEAGQRASLEIVGHDRP